MTLIVVGGCAGKSGKGQSGVGPTDVLLTMLELLVMASEPRSVLLA